MGEGAFPRIARGLQQPLPPLNGIVTAERQLRISLPWPGPLSRVGAFQIGIIIKGNNDHWEPEGPCESAWPVEEAGQLERLLTEGNKPAGSLRFTL